ncbi:M20/M25/M40 family metallo-hydrolase [Paraburkholderia strydomiana]
MDTPNPQPFDSPSHARTPQSRYPSSELKLEIELAAPILADCLRKLGLDVSERVGGYGVVGTLKKGRSEKAISLRTSMQGPSGSDDTEVLLRAATSLCQDVPFEGTVHFVFQTDQHTGGGAERMMKEGFFDRFRTDAIFSLKSWPALSAGTFGVRAGALMASSSVFNVAIHGENACHDVGHLNCDPVMAAVQLAQAFQTAIPRNFVPDNSALISLTKMHTGAAYNVIPQAASLSGVVYTFDDDTLRLHRSADVRYRQTHGGRLRRGGYFSLRAPAPGSRQP